MQTPSYTDRVMLPGVINYGNPSGYKHGNMSNSYKFEVVMRKDGRGVGSLAHFLNAAADFMEIDPELLK